MHLAHRSLVVKKDLTKHNLKALEHPPYCPDLSPPIFSSFCHLKIVLKGQSFASAYEFTAKTTRTLGEVS
jgi:transposase